MGMDRSSWQTLSLSTASFRFMQMPMAMSVSIASSDGSGFILASDAGEQSKHRVLVAGCVRSCSSPGCLSRRGVPSMQQAESWKSCDGSRARHPCAPGTGDTRREDIDGGALFTLPSNVIHRPSITLATRWSF